MKFYKCPICGNIITILEGNPSLVKCCGENLEELISNAQEASLEKHIPLCKAVGDKTEVTIGEVEHPMQENHFIMFIAQISGIETTIVKLNPGDKPSAVFQTKENAEYYAYCNTHGLWSSK